MVAPGAQLVARREPSAAAVERVKVGEHGMAVAERAVEVAAGLVPGAVAGVHDVEEETGEAVVEVCHETSGVPVPNRGRPRLMTQPADAGGSEGPSAAWAVADGSVVEEADFEAEEAYPSARAVLPKMAMCT
jgi:hypothetical protein